MMEWELVWEKVVAAQLPVILLLVLVDVGLGVAQAVRRGVFDWRRLGQFYRSDVVPYVIQYVVLFVAVELAEALGVLPVLNGIIGDGLVVGAFGVIVYNLGVSIRENLRRLGSGSPVDNPVASKGNGAGVRK